MKAHAWMLLAPWSVAAAESISADPTSVQASSSTAPAECIATMTTASGGQGRIDLRPDVAVSDDKENTYGGPTVDYQARGWDLPYNFTLNVCAAVVAPPAYEIVGVPGDDKAQQRASAAAYYTLDEKAYSLGSPSTSFHSRGKKLVLQYTNGSPCEDPPSTAKSESDSLGSLADLHANKIRRKSALISFHCDTSAPAPIGGGSPAADSSSSSSPSPSSGASFAFVGTDPDECVYFFEARSPHACLHPSHDPSRSPLYPTQPGSMGPVGVFLVMVAIALAVYLGGGIMYNRTVMHARGWRQVPHHVLWQRLAGFATDLVGMLLATVARCVPSRRGNDGYVSLRNNGSGDEYMDGDDSWANRLWQRTGRVFDSISSRSAGRSGGGYRRNSHLARGQRDAEAENRLIDQLDEQWDD